VWLTTTKFRDVPWEEISECCQQSESIELAKARWERDRGQAVRILCGALPFAYLEFPATCGGPYFDLADRPPFVVCAHMVHID
jgi:hypothetical protein